MARLKSGDRDSIGGSGGRNNSMMGVHILSKENRGDYSNFEEPMIL